MLAPNAKSAEPDGTETQDRGAFAPKFSSRIDGKHVGHNSKAREHSHVNFCLGEKPKPSLPEGRVSCDRSQACGEEPGRRKLICKQHHTTSKQNAENEKAYDRGHEPRPDCNRETRKGHSFC